MNKKLGIYIHVPFCETRCNYCHFYSVVPTKGQIEVFFDALKEEISLLCSLYAEDLKDAAVDSIYFGGGTPSCVLPERLIDIVSFLGEKFSLDCPEITLEASPKSFVENFKTKESVFFNRLSLGIVSFDDAELLSLNRHNFCVEALERARELNIENVSADILIGIPGQSAPSLEKSLATLNSFDVKGVSVYPLEADFVLSDETVVDFMKLSSSYLNSCGYKRYEVANYAKDGFRCKHNMKYWQYADYLSFGPSAASKIGRHRFKRSSNLNYYLNKTFELEEDMLLTLSDAFFEKVMMGLRLVDGIDITALEVEFGALPVEKLLRAGKKFENLVKIDGSTMRLTQEGFLFMNEFLVNIDI